MRIGKKDTVRHEGGKTIITTEDGEVIELKGAAKVGNISGSVVGSIVTNATGPVHTGNGRTIRR